MKSEILGQIIDQNLGYYAQQVGKIQIHSDCVERDDIFLALRGARQDGHDFVSNALNNGASYAIVSRVPDGITDQLLHKIILVKDVRLILVKLAHYKLESINPIIIAITGSSGKTSTKDILGHALGPRCFCSRGNFNNELGLLVNLASIPEDTQYAVLEIGMSAAGEIRKLSQIIKPHIAIITSIGPAHMMYFHDLEEIAAAKSEIFEQMRNSNSIAIIPYDTPYHHKIAVAARACGLHNIYTFGRQYGADARFSHYDLIFKNDTLSAHYIFNIFNDKFELFTTLTGRHQGYNLAAALLACLELKSENINDIMARIQNIRPLYGRGIMKSITAFDKKFTIIDDSYNSNPASLKAGLIHLADIEHSNKILFLSDMYELGHFGEEYHLDMIQYILLTKARVLITIGDLMKKVYQALILDQNNTLLEAMHFDSMQQVQNFLPDIIADDSLVYFKGSHGTNLHLVVQYIFNNAQ